MYVNDNAQALYIHIVKNGGNYVRSILKKYYNYRNLCDTPHPNQDRFYRTEHDLEMDLDQYHHSITTSGKYRYYASHPDVDPQKLTNYFSFTFVRNPYERFLSAFAYLKRTLYSNKNFCLHKTPENKDYYENFATFVRHRDDVVPVAYYHAFCTQYDQLANEKGEINISFIGRVETLDDDLIDCMTKLSKDLRHVEELYHGMRKNTNEWQDKDLTKYYDRDIFEFVNTHFQCDFETFGYRRFDSWEEFLLYYCKDKLANSAPLCSHGRNVALSKPATNLRIRPKICGELQKCTNAECSTPSRIENARGNVTLPLESHTNVGDLNRQRCNMYKTSVLVNYGMNKQYQSIEKYQRIIDVLLTQLRTHIAYQSSQDIQRMEVELNETNKNVNSMIRGMNNKMKLINEHFFEVEVEKMINVSCSWECGFGSWNELSLSSHYTTCSMKGEREDSLHFRFLQ